MLEEINILRAKYSGQSLINKIIERIHATKDAGNTESAQEGCIAGLVICMNSVAENNDDGYYDGFFKFFDEYINMINSENISEELNNISVMTINRLEGLEAGHPENPLLKAMMMALLSKVAEHGMKNAIPEAAVYSYEYQRNKLIGYSDIIDIRYRLARVNMNLITPYILCGEPEKAKTAGKEAYAVMEKLYKEAPVNYAAEFIELCSNLGGIYMDENELDSAKKIFSQGLEAWNGLPEGMKSSLEYINIATSKLILEKNMKKLTEKQKDSTEN